MISVYRKRHKDLVHFFKIERGLVVCTDIDGLMQTLNIIVDVLLGISPASNCSWPTFRSPVSVPSSKAGGRH